MVNIVYFIFWKEKIWRMGEVPCYQALMWLKVERKHIECSAR